MIVRNVDVHERHKRARRDEETASETGSSSPTRLLSVSAVASLRAAVANRQVLNRDRPLPHEDAAEEASAVHRVASSLYRERPGGRNEVDRVDVRARDRDVTGAHDRLGDGAVGSG